jgi:hypothetical protein
MKKLLLLFLTLCVGLPNLVAQTNDTVNHVIFTEWRGDGQQGAYVEITNVGDSSVNLNRFILMGMDPWDGTVDNNFNSVTDPLRLEGILGPGETYVVINAYEGLAAFENWNEGPITKPGLLAAADKIIYIPESQIFEEQGIVDISSVENRALRLWGGDYASTLWYDFSDGIREPVLIDNVNLLYENIGDYPVCDLYPPGSEVHDVAGIHNATSDHILVRKASIKEGTPWDKWDKARGIDLEDSEWIPLPFNNGTNSGGAIFNTVGNHGDFQLDYSSSVYNIDETNEVITVPWGTQRGDSIILDDDAIVIGSGMAWEYTLNTVLEDSALTICSTGDTLRLLACGNMRYEAKFQIEVSAPTDNMVEVFAKLHANGDEESDFYGTFVEGVFQPYYVTEDDAVIDTIGNVAFATRTDSLMNYLTIPGNATTSFVWVDGVERVDLKDGDKLLVTGGNGTSTKEYYIKVEEYVPGEEAKLEAIVWPDKPVFLPGWFTGDTIPTFSPTRLTYNITLPIGTSNVPALVANPIDVNAQVSVESALSLFGNFDERTTLITVISEDDSIEYVYNVTFSVEKDPADEQGLITDPIISEVGIQLFWNNCYIELANPGTEDLDISNYMLVRASNTNPADAVSSITPFANRYNKYIPGYRFTDDQVTWDADPGKVVSDATVDNIVGPGETFLMLSEGNNEARYDDELRAITDVNFAVKERGRNKWDMLFPDWQTISRVSPTSMVLLYKILNDEVLDGTKGAIDPQDFILVDAFGSADGGNYSVAGKTINTLQSVKRNPDFYIGSKNISEMVAANGTNSDDSQWTVTHKNDLPAGSHHFDVRADAGSHSFSPITGHYSTVTSRFFIVSPGYSGDQSITGTISGTLSDFLAQVDKTNEGQTLELHSAVDGSVKPETEIIAVDDTLISVSADGLNTTKYVLVNSPLSDDAMLTSSTVTIDISGATGTISGIDYGMKISDLLAAITVPDLALLYVIDGNGELIPEKQMDINGDYLSSLVGDNVYFEVIAQDNKTIITYSMLPTSTSSDAFVISSVYTVDQDLLGISNIEFGTSVPVIFNNVQAVKGATISIVDKLVQARTEGVMAYDDKLKVVSEDGTVTVFYNLNFIDEPAGLANTAPEVTVEATLDAVVDQSFKIGATVTDDGKPVGSLTYAWTVIAGDAGSVAIESADMDTTNVTISAVGTYTLQVAVSDGELTTMESVVVNVALTSVRTMSQSAMNVYPSPVIDHLNIQLTDMNDSEADLKIYNIIGVQVYNTKLYELNSRINLQHLLNGVYIVSVETKDVKLVQKIQILK